MRIETVLVRFEDGEHPVDVRYWKRVPSDNQASSSAGDEIMSPDWDRVLPGYVVTRVDGGYQAERQTRH